MRFWHCFSTLMSIPDLNGKLLFSPSVELLQWLLVLGSFLMLFGAVAALAIRYEIQPSELVSMMKRLWRSYVTELLSQILRKTRNSGVARVAPAAFTFVVAAMLATFLMASYRNPGSAKIIELHNVRVLRDIGRYDYWFQAEDGTKFYSTFCADYEPQFSAGQTLTVLKYEDRGVCWSVANTHPAYLIKRDENGKPQKD